MGLSWAPLRHPFARRCPCVLQIGQINLGAGISANQAVGSAAVAQANVGGAGDNVALSAGVSASGPGAATASQKLNVSWGGADSVGQLNVGDALPWQRNMSSNQAVGSSPGASLAQVSASGVVGPTAAVNQFAGSAPGSAHAQINQGSELWGGALVNQAVGAAGNSVQNNTLGRSGSTAVNQSAGAVGELGQLIA